MSAYRISRSCFRHIVRTVLLLYVLTLGVAMASSLVKSDSMNLICTSTGYKFVSQTGTTDDGKNAGKSMTHLLDCSLCLATALPAALPQTDAYVPQHALSYATRSIPAARLAAIVSAPLPARGPPSV